MKLVRVQLIEAGWEGYNGPMGGHTFVDAVSEPMPLRTALRIGSSLQAIDHDDGQSLHPSVYKNDFKVGEVEATMGCTLPTDAEIEHPPIPEVQAETTQEQTPAIDLTPIREVQENGSVKIIYTRAQLEAIADKGGIEALREIGAPLDVKGRAISELIDRIVEASA